MGAELLQQFLPLVRTVGSGLLLILNGKPQTGGLSLVKSLFGQRHGLTGKTDLLSVSRSGFSITCDAAPCGARGFCKKSRGKRG